MPSKNRGQSWPRPPTRRFLRMMKVHVQSRAPGRLAEGPRRVYRMAQKNFFSLKGFSDAGTGVSRGSSLAWASQYDIRSAAAFDT